MFILLSWCGGTTVLLYSLCLLLLATACFISLFRTMLHMRKVLCIISDKISLMRISNKIGVNTFELDFQCVYITSHLQPQCVQ
jgi:hypothetical protein